MMGSLKWVWLFLGVALANSLQVQLSEYEKLKIDELYLKTETSERPYINRETLSPPNKLENIANKIDSLRVWNLAHVIQREVTLLDGRRIIFVDAHCWQDLRSLEEQVGRWQSEPSTVVVRSDFIITYEDTDTSPRVERQGLPQITRGVVRIEDLERVLDYLRNRLSSDPHKVQELNQAVEQFKQQRLPIAKGIIGYRHGSPQLPREFLNAQMVREPKIAELLGPTIDDDGRYRVDWLGVKKPNLSHTRHIGDYNTLTTVVRGLTETDRQELKAFLTQILQNERLFVDSVLRVARVLCDDDEQDLSVLNRAVEQMENSFWFSGIRSHIPLDYLYELAEFNTKDETTGERVVSELERMQRDQSRNAGKLMLQDLQAANLVNRIRYHAYRDPGEVSPEPERKTIIVIADGRINASAHAIAHFPDEAENMLRQGRSYTPKYEELRQQMRMREYTAYVRIELAL